MNPDRTTDDLDELLDIVDEQDQVIGSAARSRCNNDPSLIHRAAYMLIFNARGDLFLHKRSQTKDNFPGMWSISVAGHVPKGETYEATMRREMEEEIGTVLEFRFLDKILLRHVKENEFSAIFRAESEGPFRLNPDEIQEGRFFRLHTIRDGMWAELTPFSQMVLEHLSLKGLL